MLVPEENTQPGVDSKGRPLVCGWVDHPKKVAELRSFNLVRSASEARSKSPIDLSREEYERAVQELESYDEVSDPLLYYEGRYRSTGG